MWETQEKEGKVYVRYQKVSFIKYRLLFSFHMENSFIVQSHAILSQETIKLLG